MSRTVSVTLTKDVVAYIDADKCSNCGKCRDYCPVEAISEKQKAVCHLCPDCTEIKPISSQAIIDMQSEACTLSCPLGISPQGFIQLFKAGRKREAFESIWDKNPLPATCGFVCTHPCETDCKRGRLVDQPMEIRALQRYLSTEYLDYVPAPYPVTKEERIAVIGGGPAGLTAAHWLSRKGYKVTVFEQTGEAGGMLIRGIPSFRVDKDVVRKEISRLEKAGIEIRTNVRIDPSLDEIRKNFDRIIIATGNQLSRELPLNVRKTQNVHLAINIMEKINSGAEVKLNGNVVVIGGGAVAVDTARAALRMGADKVTMICLERGEQVPAHPWEIRDAREEGIELIEGANTTAINGYPGAVESLTYERVENFDPKTFKFDVIEGSETTVPADHVIVAIGSKSDMKWEEADDVVFAGDLATARPSVIDAMASGRAAAIKIDNELSGRNYAEYTVERTVEPGDLRYKVYPAMRAKLDFKHPEHTKAEDRIKNMDVVEQGYSDDNALLETYRCLGCGYEAVDTSKCIGCGVCQKVCPKGDVISMVAAQ